MPPTPEPAGTPAQPPLAELMARYLQGRAQGFASGLAPASPGEVLPYDVAPAQVIEPRAAWDEAVAALTAMQGESGNGRPAPVPDWAALVAGQESVVAVPLCVGNYPQMLRSVQPLLQGASLAGLRPVEGRPLAADALLKRAGKAADKLPALPEALALAGSLRLARQYDEAATLLAKAAGGAGGDWQAAVANEQAALAWHRGRWDEAARAWEGLPDSTPALFNRGMAALFGDRPAAARGPLGQAVARLPEAGAWHHLGRLYLALAEIRG